MVALPSLRSIPRLGGLKFLPQRLLLFVTFVRKMLPTPPADGGGLGRAVIEAAPLFTVGLLAIMLEVHIGTVFVICSLDQIKAGCGSATVNGSAAGSSTILSSASGRCCLLASSQFAVSHVSISSWLPRITSLVPG